MPRFFTKDISENYASITGEDAVHITKVLRMKVGESIELCDMDGSDYTGVISECSDHEVKVEILDRCASCTEAKVSVTVYMALPKSDKMEFIVQKAVELGADRIVPVLTSRCVSRPDAKSMNKKIERYRKIAFEAAKQSERGKIPIVSELCNLREALMSKQPDETSLLFYERGGKKVSEIVLPSCKKISILIGPEGGFALEEVELATSCGWETATLGPRILRCETAPIAALSIIMMLTNNM